MFKYIYLIYFAVKFLYSTIRTLYFHYQTHNMISQLAYISHFKLSGKVLERSDNKFVNESNDVILFIMQNSILVLPKKTIIYTLFNKPFQLYTDKNNYKRLHHCNWKYELVQFETDPKNPDKLIVVFRNSADDNESYSFFSIDQIKVEHYEHKILKYIQFPYYSDDFLIDE